MEVLIVAKTKYGTYFCVGAIEILTKKYLRLMTSVGGYQPENTPFKIGQIWDIDYLCIPGRPPHTEDVVVKKGTFVQNLTNIKDYILNNLPIWHGEPSQLFDSKLVWKNKKGCLNNPLDVPVNSVGFWICDKNLIFNGEHYVYNTTLPMFSKMLKYKGEITPIDVIPAGTLMRVSLAKWWDMNKTTEERCYLQLSGWYL